MENVIQILMILVLFGCLYLIWQMSQILDKKSPVKRKKKVTEVGGIIEEEVRGDDLIKTLNN